MFQAGLRPTGIEIRSIAFEKLKPILQIWRRLLLAGVLAVMCPGCAMTEARMDPYSGLLPTKAKLRESNQSLDPTALKQARVYLVTGANFENYIKSWREQNDQLRGTKFMLFNVEGWNVANMRDGALAAHQRWAPEKTTETVVNALRNHFSEVVVVRDIAEARERKADWIVVFDHAFEWNQLPDLALHTNTTTVDLLDRNLTRAVRIEHSEQKAHTPYLEPPFILVASDFYAKHRADDILASISAALQKLDDRLKSNPQIALR